MGAISRNWLHKRTTYIGLVLSLNIVGVICYLYHLLESGYLPSAFIYDKSDTFMDFFNVLYWAYDSGRYVEWSSVYPPLCFIAIRLANFLFNGGGFGDPTMMRDSSLSVIIAICIGYLLVPIFLLKTKCWQDFTNIEKTLIYLTVISSAPMLFTLERGNLILIAPLILAFSMAKIGAARCVFIALLINIKPYFVILIIYYVARRDWKGFLKCSLMAALIFFSTGLMLDDNFYVFFANILNFAQEEGIFSLREIMALPSSISAFSYVLKNPDGAMIASRLLTPEHVLYVVDFIEMAKWSVLAISMSVLFIKAKQMCDSEILVLLVVFISNLGIWVGGYTFILYIALIPVLVKMKAGWLYVAALSLMALPLDIVPLLDEFIGEQYSYFAGAYVDVHWTWGLGSVIRPVVNLILLVLLSNEFYARQRKNTDTATNRNNVSSMFLR